MTFLFLIIMVMGVGSVKADTWNGTLSTSLSTQDGTNTDAGTESNPYLIQSAADLAYFGKNMNNKTWFVELTTDINLDNNEWTYGKGSATNFKGHFNGGGHTISNLKIVPTSAKYNGFFCSLQGTVAARAEVRNLTIDGVTISQSGDLAATTVTGALVGNATEYTDIVNVTVKNVRISLDNLTNANYVGALAGRFQQNRSTIQDCTVESPDIKIGTVGGAASFVGGAVGYVAGKAGLISTVKGLTVNNPSVEVNKVTVANCYIGAVFGQLNTYFSVDGVTVSSPKLQYNSAGTSNVALLLGTFAGGVKGDATQTVSVTNVNVTGIAQLTLGTESNQSTTNVQNIKGGLIGQATTNVRLEDWTIAESKVQVYGNLAGTGSQIAAFAGNITGAAAAPTIAKNISLNGNSDGTAPSCFLDITGDIKKTSYLGGFAGQITTNCRLEGCSIKKPTIILRGGIDTEATYVGGTIAYFLGAAGNTSFINGLTVTEPKVTIETIADKEHNIGAVFGRIHTFSNVAGVEVSSPTLTYIASGNPNVALDLGTFAGYITGVNTQETTVTGITIKGNAQVTIGVQDAQEPAAIKAVRAGLIGYATTNVRLEDWTIANSMVTANGSLTTTASYLGGFAGNLATDTSAPLTLRNVKITGNGSVKVTGGVEIGSYLGGFAGQIACGDKVDAFININEAGVGNTATVSVGGDISAASYLGGFAGNILGRSKSGTSATINAISLMNVDLSITGDTKSKESFYGGLAGSVNTNCTLSDWKVETADKIAIKGNISNTCDIGGAFGYVNGAANYPITVSAINITGLDMSLNGDLTAAVYLGGIAGQLTAIATPNIIERSTVSGKIQASGKYNGGNVTYAFGGVVGYMAQSATTFSEVNNCVSEVNFDLSGLTSATANNLYSGLVVGGVIGRINTPYRLPESLYYSGKIYAPAAAVGPIVGVFGKNTASDEYIYNDYTGENSSASAEEWNKVQNWYYNGYKIGLSSDVTTQTERTKNYTGATVPDGGVNYLTIGENTLTDYNSIGGETKQSKTILPYTAHNSNADKGIYPKWTTNKATYPAYYMYFMQGVNRGNYVKDDQKEKTKQDVLSGALALLTLTDSNGDLTFSTNRGFVNHTLTASATGATSYKWTVDGVEQSETTGTFVITPAIVGNTITVEAIKDGKTMSRKQMKLIPVFRVSDATKDLGTKTNPYLIGSADELQLLSYLSTLPLSTQWEKTYTSADHYNKAYYEMDGDVDLSGVAEFTPISCATGFIANSAINQGYVFDGVFDGKMYKISGLKQQWYGGAVNVDNTHVGWGLFSIVGNPIASVKVGDTGTSPAAIRNLVIDGAVLTHKTDNTTFFYGTSGKNASNCCVGVLAGIVQSNTKIDNIEIHNSQITDAGSNEYKLEARGLYVGGAVGSMQNAFNEVANPCANTKIQHVAAQVDITLEKPAFTNATAVAQPSQFNIGGIIGRYCATSALQGQVQVSMPAYTLYSGSVTASKAWISPVLGAIRYTSQQATNVWTNYSKQWEGNNNADGTQLTIINAQYYNFRINGTLMTDLRPATACARGARPIKEHTDGTESQGTYDPQKYQGVNYAARYLDSEGTSLEHLNKDLFDDIYWAWDDDGTKKFVHMTTTPPMNVSVIQGDRVYTADIENGSEPLTYSWQESTDLENWTDIAGATSRIWNVPLSYNEKKYIVAHVIKDGKVYRSFPFIYTPDSYIQPPAIKEDVSGTQHNFSLDWHDLITTDLGITYQWYQSDQTTAIGGATGETLSLTTSELNGYGESVWCKITLTSGGETIAEFFVSSGMVVVYIDGKNGIDNEPGSRVRGWTDKTPVKTIDHANSLLDGGPWDKNIIVVMGTLTPNDFKFQSSGHNPATFTGMWGGKDYKGIIKLDQIDQIGANGSPNEHLLNHATWPGEKGANCYVLGPTKFENLVFQGNNKGNTFIELHGNDAFFGKGLVMKGFKNLSDSHGNFNNEQKIPEFTIILSATNLGKNDIDAYTNRTKPQEVTFQSGHYGRILAGRFTQNFFASADNSAHSILGSPAHPYWAVVNIDIDKYNAQTDGGSTTYTCDINGLIAGLTDGTMYGDYTINFHGGNVVYIVGSNQGNPINNGEVNYAPVDGGSGKYGQWPNASYFGRTIINIDEHTGNEVKIGNVYAGGLGRKIQDGSAAAPVDMYFYGRTEVNMISGTVDGSVYGGGTGGVIGINPWDAHVPYATLDADNASNAILNGVQYGDNRQGTWSSMTSESPKAKVLLHNLQDDAETYETEILDLSESSTTVNISGGTIKDNVYGGGYGFVPDMPADATMQGVGSVFGTSNINITGGTIGGSVYGGSEGSAGYYNQVNKYGQVINHIAEMNGTVNLKITGTNAKYPIIGGNIFGGGLGIESKSATEEYLRIATAGNSELGEKYKTDINILIDLPESQPFTGNIYGGGQMGAVDGTTNVVIKGGVFQKDIFGAGKGENGHINKAKVTGTSGVTIDGGEVNATIYGGGALAIVDGNTDVNLNAGIVSQDVFGGGMGELNNDHTVKTSADVTGTANVTANGTTFKFPESGIDEKVNHNIYGGGNLASIVGATNVTINKGLLPAGFLDGAAASRWGKWIAAVNAQTDNVVQGSVFGGGYGVNTRVTNTAAVHVNVTDNDATNKAMIDVIGGGYNGCVLSNTDVTVAGVAEIYKVYGGGLGSYEGYTNAPTEKRSHANLATYTKQQTIGSVGEGKENDGTSVTIHGGKIYDNIFGGGAGLKYDANGVNYLNVAEVFGKSNVIVDAIDSWVDDANSFSNKIYGGGALGLVNNEILVDIKSGTFQGAELFAGSLGEKGHLDKAQVTASATIRTSANDSKPAGALQGYFNIYGGCDMAQMVGDTHVELHHGTFSGSIFGAGKGLESEETSPGVWDEHLDYGKVTGNTLIVIDEPSLVLGQADGLNTDGSIKDIKKAIKIYGGGALGLVDGTINPVALKSGTLYGEVFGGSLGELEHPDKAKVTMPDGKYLGVITEASKTNIVEGKPAALNGKITIYGGCDMALVDGNTNVEIAHGAFIGNVFGGGKGISGSEVYGKVDGDASVLIKGGDTRSDVYGGGALGNVTGETTVDLAGGAVNDVYGGGLGDANTAAIVFGDALVTLNGSTVDGVTNDCKVYGSIFGCNNVNGTPKGHAKVHVLKTITRAGQSTPRNQKEEKTNSYDVFAVYGGGNHAAYQPENKDEYAEVLIENCDNSIDYVYGGGNAAPVPATSVTIYGANAINNAFAGGNGAGADNPGADVGYKGHYSKGSREEYGSGEAHINIYGGTINNVYGGSNTLGYIRTHAYVEVLNVPDGDTEHNCDLRLGEVHAGGNEAEMYCGGSVTLACSEGAEVVYAGSSEADIHGDIDLVITSGTYGKVFGGNNHSGNVYGGITINIDETGCWPVMISELYACGNEAPYSVYGYNNDKSCKTEGDKLYKDPEINLISFTRIGKVFGGGYAAEVYGSPTINVEPITGKFANWKDSENNDCDWHGTPNYILDESDLRVPNTSEMTITYGQVGSIGTIYGGGNKGAVYGNTEVKIGTLEKNKHYKDKDNESVEPEEVGVTITGNIFGGGNEAIVSGDTNVTIGENKIP